MSNMIQAAREQVAALTQAAYERAAAEGLLPAGAEVKATIEIPKDVTHGDYASSFAMAGAKALRKAPRQIAEVIVSHLDLAGTFFDKVEIAGPGFLNFTLGSKWYGGVLADIQAEGETYGAVDEGRGERVMVEFVSANPTGPMHIGNARGGVLGDALAAVLERAGYDVWREFYVNDAGQPDPQVRHEHRRPLSPVGAGGGERPLPRGRLPRRRHQGAGPGLLRPARRRLEGQERGGAAGGHGRVRPVRQHPQDEGGSAAATRSSTTSGSWSHPSTTAATWPRLWSCWPARAGPMRRTGPCGSTPPPCCKQKFLAEGKSQEQVDKLDLKDDVLRRANGFYTYFAADIAYHRNKLAAAGLLQVHQHLGRRPPRPRGPPPGRLGRPGPGRLPPAGSSC